MARRKLTPESSELLSDLGQKLSKLRHEEKELGSQISDTQTAVMEIMHSHGLASHDCGSGVKITLVEPVRVVIDEARLKKSLGARLWGKITRQVVEKKLLEACIAVGEIDANVVAACADEVPSTPHIRVSHGRAAASTPAAVRSNKRGGPKKRA